MGVTVRNLGWDEIKRSIINLDDVYTKVGFPIEMTEKHEDSDTTMQTIAVVHEFGSPKNNVPARPYMRPAFDNNVKQLETMQLSAYNKALAGVNPLKAIGRVGLFMQNKIKDAITAVTTPALKVRIGGKPLVDSGQFRNSVTHVEGAR
jgi:phage gpG-like protein